LTSESKEQVAAVNASAAQTSSRCCLFFPFSFAEQTAFVDRESERATIGAAIDRAQTGIESVVMLAADPGWVRPGLEMKMMEYASRAGFRCVAGTVMKEMIRFFSVRES